jgi:hypothetical protein
MGLALTPCPSPKWERGIRNKWLGDTPKPLALRAAYRGRWLRCCVEIPRPAGGM